MSHHGPTVHGRSAPARSVLSRSLTVCELRRITARFTRLAVWFSVQQKESVAEPRDLCKHMVLARSAAQACIVPCPHGGH